MIVDLEINGNSVPTQYLAYHTLNGIKFGYDFERDKTLIKFDYDTADNFLLYFKLKGGKFSEFDEVDISAYQSKCCVHSKHDKNPEDLCINEVTKITVAETNFLFSNLFSVRLGTDFNNFKEYNNVNRIIATVKDNGKYVVELQRYAKADGHQYVVSVPNLVIDDVTYIETDK